MEKKVVPKYKQTVNSLLTYYISKGYNDHHLILYQDNVEIYNGCLECWMGEASGINILEFFRDEKNKEIIIYLE